MVAFQSAVTAVHGHRLLSRGRGRVDVQNRRRAGDREDDIGFHHINRSRKCTGPVIKVYLIMSVIGYEVGFEEFLTLSPLLSS